MTQLNGLSNNSNLIVWNSSFRICDKLTVCSVHIFYPHTVFSYKMKYSSSGNRPGNIQSSTYGKMTFRETEMSASCLTDLTVASIGAFIDRWRERSGSRLETRDLRSIVVATLPHRNNRTASRMSASRLDVLREGLFITIYQTCA